MSLHKDYEYVFWTDESCAMLVDMEYDRVLYESFPRDIHRADVCRALVLRAFGGVYVDMDTIFMKSIDTVLEKSESVRCG